ncbi:hypothetical protein PK28_11920 [Hymenobacter sp. DG25B]|nr:hypothetical protein PK28_11920 [Hymenobacter sp. DG25B]
MITIQPYFNRKMLVNKLKQPEQLYYWIDKTFFSDKVSAKDEPKVMVASDSKFQTGSILGRLPYSPKHFVFPKLQFQNLTVSLK